MALLLAAAVGLAAFTLAPSTRVPASATFEEYQGLLQREYRPHELNLRQSLFESRAKAVQTHNAKPDRIWTAGLNHLSDRTDDELKRLRGWRGGHSGADDGVPRASSLLAAQVWRARRPAASVDWRNLSVLSEVQDQGDCGSCWAVAATAVLQSHREISRGNKQPLSIQELVDCVPNPRECGGQGGCKGATVELAFKWVTENGLAEATDVPYAGSDGACAAATASSLVQDQRFLGFAKSSARSGTDLGLIAWSTLPSNRAKPLMSALMDGPVAISVSASGWFMYDSGVFDGCERDATIDHAVTLVAYGQDPKSNKKSWTIRNSWGPDWGERGHIQLLRHDTADLDDKFCGTDYKPEEGVECKPYPESVQVCGMCGMLYDSVSVHFNDGKSK